MTSIERAANTSPTSFAAWYRANLRPRLATAAPEVVELLEHGHTKDGPCLALPIFVVGVAGVGKSTVLNALLSDWMPLLPQGGVGSFTSAPVRVVFSPEPYLAIRRRPAEAIGEILRALASPPPSARAAGEARLLVAGHQFADVGPAYVVNALRAAMGGRVADDARRTDRGRLSVLAEILTRDDRRWTVLDAGSQLPELRHELENNAAGFLSPLVSELELGWNAPCLASGVQLVDLPGLGVAHDTQQRRTYAMLSRAQACLVVVDRSGLTEVCATALRPLLSRLLNSPDADWRRLLVAATQLDQLALDQRASQPREARSSWQAHFDSLGGAAQRLVRGQVAQQLAAVGLGGAGPSMDRERIVSSLRVLHVAPLEHRRLHRGDPTEPSNLSEESGAGVLRLRQAICDTGAAWVEQTMQRLCSAAATNQRLQALIGPALRELTDLLANGTSTSW